MASDSHNDEQSIEACGKAKATEDRAKKLRAKTPIGKLEEQEEGSHPFQEKEPLKPFPGGVNPCWNHNLLPSQSPFAHRQLS